MSAGCGVRRPLAALSVAGGGWWPRICQSRLGCGRVSREERPRHTRPFPPGSLHGQHHTRMPPPPVPEHGEPSA